MSKVILGGGLSGLSAAYYLSKQPNCNVVLFEASDRLGGWIKSDKQKNGVIFEQGARTIRPRGSIGANTLNLVEELNLNTEILPITNIHLAAKNRMIYVNGELHTLPNSLSGLFKTRKPFSKSLFSQLLNDLKASPKLVKDESIYEFTQRRFGTEMADYLISPMIRGICAGDAREISVNFLMKSAFQYEQKYGSVARGIFKNLFDKKKNTGVSPGKLALRSRNESWNVYTFKNGLETLPRFLEMAISRHFNVLVKRNNPISKITFQDGKAILKSSSEEISCGHVVSCVGSNVLADLVENQHPELSEMLRKIKNVTVGVVNLEFQGDLIRNPGFGFLVPPSEKLPILGAIYDSCCNVYDSTVVTVMMGGHWFKELFGDDPCEELLLNSALSSINTVLQISDKPINYKVNILRDCIPQYIVGHEENLRKIENYVKNNKLPLSVCGSSYYGVGVNDVIMSAKTAVDNINSN